MVVFTLNTLNFVKGVVRESLRSMIIYMFSHHKVHKMKT